MESGGEGEEQGGFDVFGEGSLEELLAGAGCLGGFGGLLDMAAECLERKVPVEAGEEVRGRSSGNPLIPSSHSPAAAAAAASSYGMMFFSGAEEGFPAESSNGFPQNSGASGNDNSSSSTSSSSGNSSFSKSKKKTAETRGLQAEASSTTTAGAATTTKKTIVAAAKKPRKEPPPPPPPQQRSAASHGRTLKVRKENLGDRISALQQLVSPFSKSDTASVLHEAVGYIRFLHNQVQVLSSPYLQRPPSSARRPVSILRTSSLSHGTMPLPPKSAGYEESSRRGDGGDRAVTARHDLRSRGLCLVPVSCTSKVAAGNNGADFWSPSMEGGRVVDGDSLPPDITEH